MARLVIVDRQCDLLEVVAALSASRRFAGLLHGRQEQGDQDRDDGDHNEEFDEGEGSLAEGLSGWHFAGRGVV